MERHHPQCRILELDLQAKHEAGDGQMLDDFFARHPGVGSGVTFNSKAYVVGEYLQRQGRRGFNLVGYDLLRRNVDCLRAGSICFLIAQQPRLQGYDCIKTLCDSVVLKRTVERVHYMPIDLLTKENIDFYPRVAGVKALGVAVRAKSKAPLPFVRCGRGKRGLCQAAVAQSQFL